ncbi:hypothetical protein CWI80_02985 [Pseudidiomarina sediminum]|uniref:Type II secretion system protein GspF domain-containing protein n=1 Tax=Pseudidiomarina sediminum TaxID=431675 RepID=A0A432Z8T8_9GAMM|nr:type II secretion system F family protein [Pseudidiomarina sediminum]MBY6063493.1 type II secretion system F family protein [Pseudidiomarina sediminum]RUO74323.1 hypothetical protein CWI80_02985 [Pseudidiomarina sediminum]
MRLNRAQQLAILEDIALALADGLSIAQACEELQQHAQAQGLVSEQDAIRALQQAVFQGQPIAIAMQAWFADDLCMLVSVGERSGVLAQLLAAQQRFEQQRQQALREFWRPLIYPLLMLMLCVLACFAIGQRVMPKLAGSLEPLHWPLLSQWLMFLSQPLWLLSLSVLAGLGLIWVWGPYPLIQLHWQPWRWCAHHGAFVVRRYFDGVLLLQTLTVLLAAGVSMDKALQLMERFAAGALKAVVPQLRTKLAQGQRQLAVILDCGLLSPRMLFRLSNGSRNATEHGTLQRVAGYAANDAVQALRRLKVGVQVGCYGLILILLLVSVGGMGAMLMAVTQQHVR